jgi:hypothetical protein
MKELDGIAGLPCEKIYVSQCTICEKLKKMNHEK